jgi:hypothetical protein
MKDVPLQTSHALLIIKQLFDENHIWRRAEITEEVLKRHQLAGGIQGTQSPILVVKKALTQLKAEGMLANVAYGVWSLVAEHSNGLQSQAPIEVVEKFDGDFDSIEDNDEVSDALKPKATIGAGKEAVYLYYNPTDQELAEVKGKDVWHCKVGKTTILPVDERILSQGVKTAFARLPVIALVILTDNCHSTEKALHHSLHLTSSTPKDSVGSEWFITNPDRVMAWYRHFMRGLDELG